MKQTVNFSMFCDAFERMGRAKDFSYNAKRALFDYLEEYEESTGEEIELDVIAICCDWSEHSDAMATLYDLGATAELAEILSENPDDADEQENAAREYLEERSTLIPVDGGGILVAGY